MFWSRDKKPSAKPDAGKPRGASATGFNPDALLEAALDTVADFLRSYGAHGFDTDALRADRLQEICDAWAQHLLVGTPEPLRTRIQVEPPERPPGPPKRNWGGARRFVADQREAEVQYVQDGLDQMREASWAFIQALSQSLQGDQTSDGQLLRKMHRLKNAVERDRPEEIRNRALEAVELVKEAVAGRKDRQARQMAALGARVETMRDRLNQARKAASVDQLTGLFNRAAFDEHVEHVIDLGRAFGRSACMLLVDVDHFKWLNDRHGHQAGDAVLRALGQCLQDVFLRKADFVARYGGEEFAVVLDAEEMDGAKVAAERMLEAIRALDIEHEGERLRITASAGVSRLVPGEDGQPWIERADRALYEAKNAGRDRLAIESRDDD